MKKYNGNLFIIGFLMNIINKFPLIIIAVICGIVGIRVKPCLYISSGVIAVVLIWSLIQQLAIKHTVEHSDNPNFTPFANAMMSDNWKDEINNIVNDKIHKEDDEINKEEDENNKE